MHKWARTNTEKSKCTLTIRLGLKLFCYFSKPLIFTAKLAYRCNNCLWSHWSTSIAAIATWLLPPTLFPASFIQTKQTLNIQSTADETFQIKFQPVFALGSEIITQKALRPSLAHAHITKSVFFHRPSIWRALCVCLNGFLLIGGKMFLMLLMRFSDWPANGKMEAPFSINFQLKS